MKTIKMGIFGIGGRGKAFYKNILANNGEIVAVCDNCDEYLEAARRDLGEDLAIYTNFEDFIEHKGLDAVLISNFFHEHAPYAIKALERGIHVLSECTSNGTMAEGVALVRAVEKSKATYMLAENYPFMLFNREMKKVYEGGTLGKAIYCEGEYNHPLDPNDTDTVITLCPSSKHWRYSLPRCYYITHSLAPIMHITGATPKRVTAMPVLAPFEDTYPNGISKGVPERASIITCLNDDDSVFRVTGCASFGAHENSYRICCEKGQMENLRDRSGKVILSYNKWEKPEGVDAVSCYQPVLDDKDAKLIEESGHGGGDFCVIREFFESIREGRKPAFDVYFATSMASVAILAHRSMLECGTPYDVPDFRREEDRVKYENDRTSPFYGSDGTEPTIASTKHIEYKFTPEKMAEYDRQVAELKAKKENK